jgi:hypothetical protein
MADVKKDNVPLEDLLRKGGIFTETGLELLMRIIDVLKDTNKKLDTLIQIMDE